MGFALGHPDLIQALVRVKDSFNSYPLDKLATLGASASLDDKVYFSDTCQRVMQTRDQLTLKLKALGFEVLPSQANFVFAQHPKHQGKDLAQSLRNKQVIVRHFQAPRIENFLRITVGTDAECAQLIKALESIIS